MKTFEISVSKSEIKEVRRLIKIKKYFSTFDCCYVGTKNHVGH